MRLKSIICAGFRGIRGRLEIQIPPGFLIITGRNGAGKSTICDAIEYALTGDLRRQEGESERQERIEDYIWWRGEGEPNERFVSLSFVDETGEERAVRRTPRGLGPGVSEEELAEFLTLADRAPEKAVHRLLQTAIIRDEEITRLSIDLPETQRFQFVRAAVGEADLSSYTDPLSSVCNELRKRAETSEQEYIRKREVINRLVESISEKEASISSDEEVSRARDFLVSQVGGDIDSDSLVSRARSRLVDLREELSQLGQLSVSLQKVDVDLQHLRSEEALERAANLERMQKELATELAASRIEREAAEARAAELAAQKSDAFSWAELLRHGRHVGLQDEQCPLCGSQVSESDFQAHLEKVRERIRSADREASEAKESLAQATARENALQQRLDAATRETGEHDHRVMDVSNRRTELLESVRAFGVTVDSLEQVERLLEEKRLAVRRLEREILTVESSSVAEKLAELHSDLTQARSEADATQLRATQVRTQWKNAKQALDALRRIEGEIIEERLAALGPLLEELYLRLRPHLEWTQIRYHIRGDVRRFLSLKVGEELNPRFMFSSGQRRAIGIAFLLAAHLSTNWSRLRTLVLDDPVQHIDDFRALHLVELFSALRAGNWQVVCTAEDSELAELMARRLRGLRQENGALAELEYEPGRGTYLGDYKILQPIEKTVMQTA